MRKISMNRKFKLASLMAAAALMAWSSASLAQTCTIENWTGTPIELSNANAGTQGANNRRYAGPCGLRVPVDGTERFLTDPSPNGESSLNARFFAFLNDAGSQPIILYAAEGGTPLADQIQVVYNEPAAGDLSLSVFDANGGRNLLTFESIGSGWHSIEFAWQADSDATIAFSVNGATDLTTTLNTAGITLDNSVLGNINGATGPGSIDFDDFDSRRDTRPGRLCRGLTDESRNELDFDDTFAIFDEIASGGANPAAGQPDFNEDGEVDFDDVFDIFGRIAIGAADCSLNQ